MGRQWGTRRVKRIRALSGSISTVVCCWNFAASTITSDAGLLAYRELDDTLSLTDTGANALADARTGKNVATGWPVCCVNRCSGGWPAMRT